MLTNLFGSLKIFSVQQCIMLDLNLLYIQMEGGGVMYTAALHLQIKYSVDGLTMPRLVRR